MLGSEINKTGCAGARTGNSCNLTCADGFEGTSTENSCSRTGALVGQIPDCSRAKCPDLSASAGLHDCYNVTYGGKCTRSCDAGYTLAGPLAVYVCGLSSGQLILEGTPPTCLAEPCTVGLLGGDKMRKENCSAAKTGDTCMVECNDGYVGNATTLTCMDTGVLTGRLPECSAATCSEADVTQTNDCSEKNLVFGGESCFANCETGFAADGYISAEFKCDFNTSSKRVQMMGKALDCKALECIFGRPSGTGVKSNCSDEARYKDTCVARCDEGYTGSPTTFRCDDKKTFRGTNPTCTLITSTTTNATTKATTKITTKTTIGASTSSTGTSMVNTTVKPKQEGSSGAAYHGLVGSVIVMTASVGTSCI